MADQPTIHFGENSPEYVALILYRMVRDVEHSSAAQGQAPIDRKYILDTYAECLETVRAARSPSQTTADVARATAEMRASEAEGDEY